MSNDFLRQRRNLIIVCCILIFLKFSKVQISNFGILGVEFSSFNNPESIYLAIWVGWIYFVIRYYQYFSQEGLQNFKRELSKIIELKSIPLIKSMISKVQPKIVDRNVSYQILQSWNWKYSGDIDNDKNESGNITGINIERFEYDLPQSRFYPMLIRSFVHIIVNRSAFSDYIFPIFLALFAAIYCSVGWAGSLPKVIALIKT